MDELCAETERVIEGHLQRRNLWKSDKLWKVGKSRYGGRGVFATRNIQQGEIIFVDSPVILGPRAIPENTCVSCYDDASISLCSGDCGLYICETCRTSGNNKHSKECEKINSWKTERSQITDKMMICLAPIRSLFVDKFDSRLIRLLAAHKNTQHGVEVDLMKERFGLDIGEDEELIRLTCAVLDANSFEVLAKTGPTLRGLFPLSSLLNHSCTPNVMHVFDVDHHMILKAAKSIKKDEEIFLTYSRILWCTLSRRSHLMRTKNFACQCNRCKDPKECGTYLSAILCESCNGSVLPITPLKFKGEWACETCGNKVDEEKAAFIMCTLANRFKEVSDDHKKNLDLFQRKTEMIIPRCNQVSMEFMYRTIWILGCEELTDEMLKIKVHYLNDILEVLRKLNVGASKMRGLMLFELYKCQNELVSRDILKESKSNANALLEEASKIFMFDVSAPEIIKCVWKQNHIPDDWRTYFF